MTGIIGTWTSQMEMVTRVDLCQAKHPPLRREDFNEATGQSGHNLC